MPDAYGAIQEWPKMLYRPSEAGGVEKRVFHAPDHVPEGQGWGESKDAWAKAKPAPVKETVDAKKLARKEHELASLTNELVEAQKMLAKEQANTHDLRNQLGAAVARAADLAAFVQKIISDPDAPADVKSAGLALLNPEPAPEPEPRRRKLSSRPQE